VVLKSLPNPFISLLVSVKPLVRCKSPVKKKLAKRMPRIPTRASHAPYRSVDLSPDDFNLTGLRERLAVVFGAESDEHVASIVLERAGVELWRNEDLRLLQSMDKLVVSFAANTAREKHEDGLND
jgi:hypothetical protein